MLSDLPIVASGQQIEVLTGATIDYNQITCSGHAVIYDQVTDTREQIGSFRFEAEAREDMFSQMTRSVLSIIESRQLESQSTKTIRLRRQNNSYLALSSNGRQATIPAPEKFQIVLDNLSRNPNLPHKEFLLMLQAENMYRSYPYETFRTHKRSFNSAIETYFDISDALSGKDRSIKGLQLNDRIRIMSAGEPGSEG